MKKGIITPNGVSLERHESDTIVFFTNLGKNIELIPPSNTPHNKSPDFIMDNLPWEMKSPKDTSKIVVERALHRALTQSCNVIIDLRRARGNSAIAAKHLQNCFISSRKAKRLYVITKKSQLLDFKK